MNDIEFLISKTPEGVVASSTSSPYFCFVADTEAAVLATVKRALTFYQEARSSEGYVDRLPSSTPLTVTPLVPGRRMTARELMVA